MGATKVRVPGGGNTYLIAGTETKRIEFLANFSDRPGGPVGNVTAIHPIGHAYPVEIATPYAQNMGQLTLTVWSLWGEDGWVSGLENTGAFSKGYASEHGVKGKPVDLREVFDAQRKSNTPLIIYKVELGSEGKVARGKMYEGCVVSNIDANEDIRNDSMQQQVTITLNYRYVHIVSGDAKLGSGGNIVATDYAG